MNYDWDQTYIIDGERRFPSHHAIPCPFTLSQFTTGMTTIEHPLPIPKLYDDVMILFAMSGTGSTPTHIVNYGGVFLLTGGRNQNYCERPHPHYILSSSALKPARRLEQFALANTHDRHRTSRIIQF